MIPVSKAHPVAVGGLGGSGTRVFAELLKLYGFHMGSDLNVSADNLSFTLLFKRRSALLDDEVSFKRLADIFFSSVQGKNISSIVDLDLIFSLAKNDRMGHSREWLRERAELLTSHQDSVGTSCWGWKEPNTHIFIDKFLGLNDKLKYIHVLRNPFYMAHSKNQNQLVNWGAVFFDGDFEISPRNSLKLWRKVHERILALGKIYANRVLLVRYEDLINNPLVVITIIEKFLNIKTSSFNFNDFKEEISSHQYDRKSTIADLSIFDPEDVAYIVQHWSEDV